MADAVAYQVLARKYRPQSFPEVVGQPGVVSTLKNAIDHKRLHHAYLFSGTRGVGKTTLARLFARALNCVKGPTTQPCGDCDPCREIIAGTSMDVIEIDGASNRKVEDVDPLRESARYAPARDRHKVFIIDEVHMLSETAFNALLKILEEPPPRTLFLFATTEPEEVPDTIMSRCLHLACRRVARQEIADALARTADAEKIEGTREGFDLIAGLAAGSMRDGLSLLDQVIAFSGGQVDGDAVRQALGLIDRGMIDEFIEAIAGKDATAALAVIDRLSEAGSDLTHFCREALGRVRDVMVCKAAGASSAAIAGLAKEERDRCERVADLFSSDGLLRLTQAMLDLAGAIRSDEHPRILLEASALKMIRLSDLTPIEDLIQQLGAAGVAPSGAAPGGHSSRSQAGPSGQRGTRRSAPATSAAPPAGQAAKPGTAPKRSAIVGRLLDRIGRRKVSLATFLGQARGIEERDGVLVVTVPEKQGFVKTALESEDNLALIREEATAELGRSTDVRVEFEPPESDDLAVVASMEAGGEGNGQRERLINEALKEPVVRTVMDMFKGQIVDIREGR